MERSRIARCRARAPPPPARNRSRWRPRQTVTRAAPWTCHAPSRPTTAVSSSIPRTTEPARRLQRDERAERLGPGVVVRHDRRRRGEAQPGAPAQRPRQEPGPELERMAGQDHRPGRATGQHRAAVVGSGRAAPTAAPARDRAGGPGLAAGQVDEVRLADRLGRPGSSAPSDRGRGPARPPRPSAAKWPRPSPPSAGTRPRRRGRTRSAGSTTRGRATPGRRRADRHRWRPSAGRNSPAPTSATGPGIPRESICETARYRDDAAPALDARRDGHRVRRGLPRRHRRQRRPAQRSARSCRRRSSASSRARPTSSAATSRSSPPCSSSRGAVRPLRPTPRLRDRPGASFAVDLGPVRPRPDHGMAGRLPAAPGRRGALLVPGALCPHHQTLRGPERGRAFGIWAAATSASTLLGPLVGGFIVDTIGWRFAFLINVPVLAFALWVTFRHVAESRDTAARPPVRLARLGRGRPRGRRPVVRAHPRQQQNGRTRPAWVSSSSGSSPHRLPDPHGHAARTRSCPLSLFRSRAFATINLATFFIYGALYVRSATRASSSRASSATRRSAAGAVGLPIGILPDDPVDADRDGRRAGRLAAVPRRRAAAHGARRCCGTRACRSTRQPWLASSPSPSTLVPPLDVLVDVLPSILLFGLGMSCVVAPLTNTLMGSIPAGSRARVGHQQLDLAGRPAAARRAHLHRHQRHVLRDARALAPELDTATRSGAPRPSHRSTRRGRRAGRGSRRPNEASDRRLPPGDVRRGGPARRRRGRVVVGLRDEPRRRDLEAAKPRRPSADRARRATVPRDWDARTYDRVADPMTRWGDGRPGPAAARAATNASSTPAAAAAGSPSSWPSAWPRGRVVALDGSPSMVEPRASGCPLRRRDRVRRGRPRRAAADRRSRSTPSCRRRPSTGCPTTTRCSRTSPRSAAGRLARRPVRRRRQHRVGPAGPGDDRRRLARQRPLRDALATTGGSTRPGSSTSSAG